MKPYRLAPWLLTPWLLLALACGGEPGPVQDRAPAATTPNVAETSPQDVWWSRLRDLCGQAFTGAMVSDDPADAALADQPLVAHLRRCDGDRLEIPFHVGADRSRTWVLSRTDTGLRLQHDHRHEDGSADAVTLYGGHTLDGGTDTTQSFPADDYSKRLFTDQGLDPSVANVWSLELVPGERLSYVLRRPQRHFRADFDLRSPVAPPPAPWGHE